MSASFYPFFFFVNNLKDKRKKFVDYLLLFLAEMRDVVLQYHRIFVLLERRKKESKVCKVKMLS